MKHRFDPEVLANVLYHALACEPLSDWFGEHWERARSHVRQTSGGWANRNSLGSRRQDGIYAWVERGPHGYDTSRAPDIFISWTDVRDILRRGATPERQRQYSEAYRAYVHGGSGRPIGAVAREIIQAGCERSRQPEQEMLF